MKKTKLAISRKVEYQDEIWHLGKIDMSQYTALIWRTTIAESNGETHYDIENKQVPLEELYIVEDESLQIKYKN